MSRNERKIRMKLEDNNKSIGQLRNELARLEKSIEHRNPPSILHGRVDELRAAIAAKVEKESCPKCGGWGGGAWNGNDSPFEGYMPC